MNTEQFFTNAAAHFLEHYKPGDPARDLFERYATEELKLMTTPAKAFAREVEKGSWYKSNDDNVEQKRFYLWYYINYMVNKEPDNQTGGESGERSRP